MESGLKMDWDSGLDEFVKALKKAPKHLQKQVASEALIPGQKEMFSSARANAARFKKTGRLYRAFRKQKVEAGAFLSVPVLVKAGRKRTDGSGAFYAPFLERGTRKGIEARRFIKNAFDLHARKTLEKAMSVFKRGVDTL